MSGATATSGGVSVSEDFHTNHPLRHHNDHRDHGSSNPVAASPAGVSSAASPAGMSRRRDNRDTETGPDQGCPSGGCSKASSSSGSAATARTKSGVASKNNQNNNNSGGAGSSSDRGAKKQSNNIHSASPMQPHNTSKYPGRSTVPGYTRYLLNNASFKTSLTLKIDLTH